MNWKKKLTPKNTEEVRPGLFIQKWFDTKKEGRYRVINPICWKGKYRWRKQFSWGNLITIIIILFLVWTYFSATEFCRELQKDPCEILPDIEEFCSVKINEVDYGEEEYTVTIQDYP